MLTFILICLAAIYAGDTALDRVERAQALQCARHSERTDMAIVDCYTSRGLPVPEDMR
jgi:hypothetical protein